MNDYSNHDRNDLLEEIAELHRELANIKDELSMERVSLNELFDLDRPGDNCDEWASGIQEWIDDRRKEYCERMFRFQEPPAEPFDTPKDVANLAFGQKISERLYPKDP